jgi:hypothetical protein
MYRFENARRQAKAALFAFMFVSSIATAAAQAMMKASPQQAQASLTGSISAINGNTIFVAAPDGTATAVAIGKDTLILGRRSSTLESIQPGEALGVAATRGSDGGLTATAINVFPAALWQRVRKGQFPMDNGQVMTNAQVESVGAGGQGRRLFLKYEMLAATVDVPKDADIRRSLDLRLTDLKVGEQVNARGAAGPGGMLSASILSVDLPAS